MKRQLFFAVTGAVVVVLLIAAYFLAPGGGWPRAEVGQVMAAPSTTPSTVALPQQAAAVPPPMATPIATDATKSPPPIIAKMAAAVHKTPLNRPMTEVAKSWFGCRSEEAYNATLDLLTRNDPASAERFKGAQADCVALDAGRQIKVVELDTSNNVVEIRLADSQAVLWTDAAALSGHGQHGKDGT